MNSPVEEQYILRVLICEADEREEARLLLALRGGGHVVYSQRVDTPQALAEALAEGGWGIVLLNTSLPGLPAAEALYSVRDADENVPVILVIERGSRNLPPELLESGAQDFVFKSNLVRLLPVVERECVNLQLRRDGEEAVRAVREAAALLGESEARFLQLAGNIPECFWLIEAATSRIAYVSRAYEQIWGRYVNALYADPGDWLKHVHPEDRLSVDNAMRHHAEGGLDIRFRVIRPEGSVRWLHARNFPIRNNEGTVVSIGGVASDITSFVADQRQIAHLAHFDALTALPNELSFYERLHNLLSLSKRTGMGLAVMMIDIDRFHTINEMLGHVGGDELLRQIAGRLSGSLRESDTVGRINGDVFAAILTEIEDQPQAMVVARRAIDMLAEPVRIEGHELFATASIGVAFYPQDGKERHELMRNAETAMRRAKAMGRNSMHFYSPSLHDEAHDKLVLETDLRNAIMREEFLLAYQPKVSCANGRVTGAEALLRWNHPRRGIVPPDQFIPLLEETGLIISVGRWVLQKACEQAVAWRKEGLELPSVSVNLSARQLQSETLFDDISHALQQSGLPAACLDLEITESMLMQQADSAVAVLSSMKALGVTISLDDFGTGYSSLAYLKRFPLDAVKVDRSFVQDITADSDDASITRAVITMAHHLKLKVVAEGVETEGQLSLLISSQCDVIQGYFFARPLSVEDMATCLREGRHLPPNLLRSGTRKPMALFAGVEGFDEVVEQLQRDGHRVCCAPDVESARQWFAGNLADVVVCGSPRRDFDALGLLRDAREMQPLCERFVLADDSHWRMLGIASSDGTADRLLRLPIEPDTLRRLIEEALERRQITDEHDRLAEEMEVATREIVRIESERRELEVEYQRLQEQEHNSYVIMQQVMHELPWPVMGVDADGILALVNTAAETEFAGRMVVVGSLLAEVLPEVPDYPENGSVEVDGRRYQTWWRTVQAGNGGYGRLLLIQGNGS